MDQNRELQNLISHLRQAVFAPFHVSDQTWQEFSESLSICKFKSHDQLQNSDKPVRQGWFILNGFVQMYIRTSQSKKVTLGFFAEEEMVCSYASFIRNQQQSDVSIEALEDVVSLSFDLSVLRRLADNHREWSDVLRYFAEQNFLNLYGRMYSQLALNAHERFELFEKNYSKIATRMTQAQIASYLGLTREAINRVKSARLKKRKQSYKSKKLSEK